MKSFSILLVLVFAIFGMASANICGGEGNASNSTMIINVKKVVGSEKKAEMLKSELMAMKGVKNVECCTHSGNVTISYSKAELGCCSVLHTSLKNNKWKYEMVSNEEKPACAKDKACCKDKKGCQDNGHKGCEGKSKSNS